MLKVNDKKERKLAMRNANGYDTHFFKWRVKGNKRTIVRSKIV